MSAVARCLVDTIATGHGCDATALIQGNLQTMVFVNGSFASVAGDPIAPHTIPAGPICVPHTAFVNQGSTRVFAMGIPIARVGDSADLGSIITGSATVFAGG